MKMKILIVEDDVAIRRVERFILEQEGFSVVEVGSEEECDRPLSPRCCPMGK